MPPSAVALIVLVGCVLGVVDQHVGTLGQFAKPLVGRRITGFVVRLAPYGVFAIAGHAAGTMRGDELLVKASQRLEKCLRSGDVFARLGGDEGG